MAAETLDELILKVSTKDVDKAAQGFRNVAASVTALSTATARAIKVVSGFNTAVRDMGNSAKVAQVITRVVNNMDKLTTGQMKAATSSRNLRTELDKEANSWRNLSAAEQKAVNQLAFRAKEKRYSDVPESDKPVFTTSQGAVTSTMGSQEKELQRIKTLQQQIKSFSLLPPDAQAAAQRIAELGRQYTYLDSTGKQVTVTQRQINSELSRVQGEAKRAAEAAKRLAAEQSRAAQASKHQKKSLLDSIGAFGKFTAIAWSVIAAFRVLGKVFTATVGKQMSYFETLNFATVTFGNAYDEAFKFSQVMSSGLGFDPAEMLKTQSSVNELATSMGIGAKNSYTMSQGLTQLAYDLASFRDVPIEQVFQNIQSGIAGEARALRRYGVDITVAALQETALSMGITERVKNMTQAEKAQLRYITIMKHTVNAQGDMARTLYQPANMLRVLKDQVGQVGRALGALLVPAIQATLPYLILLANTALKALQALAKLFNINLPKFEGAGYDMAGGFEDVEEAADGIGGAMGGAAKAAKKMRDYALGIDELNILAPEQADTGGGGGGGGGGVGGSTSDYDLGSIYDALLGTNPLEELLSRTRESLSGLAELFKPFSDAIKDVFPIVMEYARELGSIFGWLFKEVAGPIIEWFIEKILPRLVKIWGAVVSVLTPVIQILGDALVYIWHYILEPIFIGLQPVIEKFLDNFATGIEFLGGALTNLRPIFQKVFRALGDSITPVIDLVVSLLGWWSVFADKVPSIWQRVIGHIQGYINTFINFINGILRGFNKLLDVLRKLPGFEGLKTVELLQNIILNNATNAGTNRTSRVAEYASGGYPSAGSLFIAGEAGAELIGTHNNKTTVMPLENTSFVAAVGAAVYDAVVSATQQNDGTVVINLDGRKVGEGVTKASMRAGLNNPQIRIN